MLAFQPDWAEESFDLNQTSDLRGPQEPQLPEQPFELLVRSVKETFQPHERDHFTGHYRHLIAKWSKTHAAGV